MAEVKRLPTLEELSGMAVDSFFKTLREKTGAPTGNLGWDAQHEFLQAADRVTAAWCRANGAGVVLPAGA